MVEYVKNNSWKIPMEKLKKYRYPALILLLGLLLLLLPVDKKSEPVQEEPEQSDSGEAFDLESFTEEAETILSGVQGAGEVKLLLTLDTDGAWDYLSDYTESQGDGTSQSQSQAVLVSGDGSQAPVTVSRSYPQFRGAVVLCQGADSPSLTLRLKEALSSLTGLGMDKITVLKSD